MELITRPWGLYRSCLLISALRIAAVFADAVRDAECGCAASAGVMPASATTDAADPTVAIALVRHCFTSSSFNSITERYFE